MSENEKEEFAFIKEKIKNKPLNKRRIILKTAFTVVLLWTCILFCIYMDAPGDGRVAE